jgi:hypothetical protein
MSWRRSVVVIASADRTDDRGLESLHGVRFLGLVHAFLCNLICIVIVCMYLCVKSMSKTCMHKISWFLGNAVLA